MMKKILMTIAALFGAVQTWGATVECSTWAEVKTALEAGNNVKLTEDISISTTGQAFTRGSGTSGAATLDLNGHKIDAYNGTTTAGETDRLFLFYDGSNYKLTICDSVGGGSIVGHKSIGHPGGMIYISGTSQLILNSGTISGFSSTGTAGSICVNGGTFTMNGGTISNSKSDYYGGAVYVYAGTMTMDGGTIANCTAAKDGGAVYNKGTFTMNGGVLTGNTANSSTTSASAIIYNNGGTATVNGGVSDNSHIGDFKASDKSCTQVGTKYVVGVGVASDANNQLTAGTYTFCPTNAEYAAAGVAVKEGKFINAATAVTPKTWTISDYETKADPSSAYTPTKIINGGFEKFPWMDYKVNGVRVSQPPSPFVKIENAVLYPNGVDGGWNSTETTVSATTGSSFENYYDADSSTADKGTRSDGVRTLGYWTTKGDCGNDNLYNRGQGIFIEMNLSHADTLYQDLTTYGGDVIRWSLKHGFRNKNDTDTYQPITTYIGAPLKSGSTIVQPTRDNVNINSATLGTYTYSGCSGTYAYGNSSELAALRLSNTQADKWYTAQGVYVIPESQSVTRFAFKSNAQTANSGNFLDDVTFSTLIGNLKARVNDDGSVTITGYWGDSDTSKKLMVKIGSGTAEAIDMSGVLNKNFKITVTAEKIGSANSLEVYHQDYASAKRTVKIGWAVTLNLNAADATCAKLTEYQRGVVTTLPVPTRTNYAFDGWFDNESLTGDAVTSIPADATGAKEFWAKWTPYVSVAIPSVEHTTVTNITVNGKVVTVTSPIMVPPNGTIVVYYGPNAGYHLTGDTAATLSNVTEDNKTIDSSKVTAEKGVLCYTWADVKAALEANYDVKLAQNVTHSGASGTTASISGGKTPTLDLNGNTITCYGSSAAARPFYVSGSGTVLTITGSGIIDGQGKTLNDGGAFAQVANSGKLVLSGGTIQSFKVSGQYGHGAAVQLTDTGYFEMNGGAISNCASEAGAAGAIHVYSGAFTMTGGTITCCTANGNGGAVYNDGTVTITGGTISDCSAANGGAILNSGTGTMTVGDILISGCTASGSGGAVYAYGGNKNRGWNTMTGGTITNCTAGVNGGAVYDDALTFTITGGAIVGNKAGSLGGGVYVDTNGALTLGGDVEIRDNTVSSAANNVALASGKTITVSTATPLTEDAKIGVTTVTAPTAAAPVAVTSNRGVDYGSFTSDSSAYSVENLDGVVKLAALIQVGDDAWARIKGGVCTITGTSSTWDFTSKLNPIDDSWESITNVVVANGVTELGAYTFHKFYNITNMTLASSVTNLATGSIFLCHSLRSVSFLGETMPTMETNVLNLKAGIVMEGGKPVVTLVPKVTVNGKSPTLQGSNDLETWVTVESGNEGDYHFFKYVIGD